MHRQAFSGLAMLVLVMASLLFGAAGTLRYWQAWLFLAVYFAVSLAITLYLMKKDPALLARRMRGGPFAESEPAQKIIMSFASLGFIASPRLCPPSTIGCTGPRCRLMPHWQATLLVLLGWLGIFFVFRENSFSSATIELAADQTVISTGPYAWVRHPMYAAALSAARHAHRVGVVVGRAVSQRSCPH